MCRLEYAQFPAIDKAAALLFFDLAEIFSGLNEFPHKPTRAALRSNSSLWENSFSVLSFLRLESESAFVCVEQLFLWRPKVLRHSAFQNIASDISLDDRADMLNQILHVPLLRRTCVIKQGLCGH